MEPVFLSAYMMTRPSAFLAARPIVWIRDTSERRNPSLSGIQDGDQFAFGNIETFAQQVYAHQNIEGTEPEVTEDLDPLKRVDVRMHVTNPDALFEQVLGQVFCHAFRQGGDESPGSPSGDLPNFGQQVVNLGFDRPDTDAGVNEPGGPDHLFGEHAFCLFQFPCPRRCRYKHRSRAHCIPFAEFQGAVVDTTSAAGSHVSPA